MTNLDNVLQQLRQEHKQAQIQVEKLKEAISVIEGLGTNSSRTSVNGSRPKRIISAAKTNGADSEGQMGESWERATTSIEDDWHGSQAHYVNCCSAEDRSSTTGKVGKG